VIERDTLDADAPAAVRAHRAVSVE
jgi:hypothetical protein